MENVYLFELNSVSAKRIIKDIAERTEKVIITDHVRARMKQRRITTAQVLDCLRRGLVREEPVFNDRYGSWEIKLEVITSGDIVNVIAALRKDKSGYVVVVTAYKGD